MFSHVRRSVITSIVPLCLPWLSCGSASLVRYQAARTARAVLYYAPAIAVASRDLHFLLSLVHIIVIIMIASVPSVSPFFLLLIVSSHRSTRSRAELCRRG